MRAHSLGRALQLLLAVPVLGTALLAPARASAAGPETLITGFPSVQQWYSLSCEYAAAAAVTLYYGRLVSQRDFIVEVPPSPNPHLGFRGDINGEWGGTTDYGVYAEALVPVLERRGYQATVFYDSAPRLRDELDAGHPVVIWMSGRRGSLPRTYLSYQGSNFSVTPYEHTVVAYGYDDDGVHVMDVGNGQRYYYAWSSLLARWSYFDGMALVITPAWR